MTEKRKELHRRPVQRGSKMSEIKVVNILLSSLLLMTIVMFSWTFVYINKIQTSSNVSIPVVYAFNA